MILLRPRAEPGAARGPHDFLKTLFFSGFGSKFSKTLLKASIAPLFKKSWVDHIFGSNATKVVSEVSVKAIPKIR